MPVLVLLRHGQSAWNLENRFTGWADVGLSEQGVAEAREAGRLLLEGGYDFDVVYTSVLKRAIRTLWEVMGAMDREWLPVVRDWRLNERHYGALQGLNKAETAQIHGAEQVQVWRRSYATPPPPLPAGDPRWSGGDRRYAALRPDQIPRTESLKDTVDRVLPCWNERIAPEVRAGRRALIVAHGNSLRALVKHLDGISDAAITELDIPTGRPQVRELDADLTAVRSFYLG